MSISRDGWLDERPYSALRTPEGDVLKYLCLKCGGETPPDPDAFVGHSCEQQEDRSVDVDTATVEVDATDAALELAMDRGIDITEVEGTGQGGRVTKGDVQDHDEG